MATMLRFVVFGVVAVFAYAASNVYRPDPNGIYNGRVCPWAIESNCSIRPIIEDACMDINFGTCYKSPSHNVKFHFKSIYDPNRDTVTFERFLDEDCTDRDERWAHETPKGKPGECIGPVAMVEGYGPIYVTITVNNIPVSV